MRLILQGGVGAEDLVSHLWNGTGLHCVATSTDIEFFGPGICLSERHSGQGSEGDASSSGCQH